jgi:4-hydroxybenzoate polyprenyltransferase
MTRLLFHKVNVLSIDVALGSVCAALFFGKYVAVEISPVTLAVLALTVWIIYTVDHLMDAKRITGQASSERHRFHQQHFVLLRNAVICATLLTAALLFFLPVNLLLHGVILSAGVVTYILLHSYFPYVKELAVAVIYTMGVFLPAAQELKVMDYPFALLTSFAIVALINLLLFSWFSEDEDRRDGISSLTTFAGRKVLVVISLALLIQLSLAIHSAFSSEFLILFAMSVALAAMLLFPAFFRKHDRYRIGDAVFFVTLLYLFL